MNNFEMTTDVKKDLLTGNNKFCKGGFLSFDEIHFLAKGEICLYFEGTLVATQTVIDRSLKRDETVVLRGFEGTMRFIFEIE